MPRPGPRPYECVRRAWHSDRHQPMRGSLIQELFRMVNESHSEAIRKNKEWQEKLPVVVLKAEEIMYSKANSEAEYMDLTTLWERANDAVDTIIRKDDSAEDGKFLQPCIEAALNLGCTPRRASRSQRHNSRCYLSSSTQQDNGTCTATASKDPKNLSFNMPSFSVPQLGNSIVSPRGPRLVPYYLPQFTPRPIGSPINQRYPLPVSASQYPFCSETVPFSVEDKSFLPQGTCPLSSRGHAYPLYFGNASAGMMHFNVPKKQLPKCSPVNLQPFHNQTIPEAKIQRSIQVPEDGNTHFVSTNRGSKGATHATFDLSLRLGPVSSHCPSSENRGDDEVEDLGSINSRDGKKYAEFSPQKSRLCNLNNFFSAEERDKELPFFPLNAVDDVLESCPSRRCLEGEVVAAEASVGKRKSPAGDGFSVDHLFWKPLISTNQLQGTKKPHFS
ncbi:uncharacterized protein LOC116267804 [Nymphaea colorata]|nr:uncharacterized protein LOC116267804 [Nymphaea colorata]